MSYLTDVMAEFFHKLRRDIKEAAAWRTTGRI